MKFVKILRNTLTTINSYCRLKGNTLILLNTDFFRSRENTVSNDLTVIWEGLGSLPWNASVLCVLCHKREAGLAKDQIMYYKLKLFSLYTPDIII